MRTLSSLAVLLLTGWSQAAHAACDAAYLPDQLLSDIQLTQSALRVDAPDNLIDAGTRLERGVACLSESVPPQVFATAYRMLGVFAFTQDDVEKATGWFRTARELDPAFAWDVMDMDTDSPMRALYDQQAGEMDADPVAVDDMQLAVPSGSELTLDGRPLRAPEATMGRFHVLLEVDKGSKSVLNGYIIRGNAIPEGYLEEARAPVAAADPEESEASPSGRMSRKDREAAEASGYAEEEVQVMSRVVPKAKYPVLIGGLAGIVAAGGVYGASFWARSQFDQASTSEEVASTKSLTNTLVLASGGVALLGAGFTVWGAAMDGGPTIGVHYRW